MLEFNIRNQEISRIDNFSPAEKSVEYLIAKFNFKTDDWNEAIKRAIFRNVKSKVEKDAMLEDDSCIVPWEVLVGSSDIEVSVHGVIDTEEITTDVAVFNLDRTLSGGSASQEPSPTVYEQMLKEMQETKEIAQSVRDDADAGKFGGGTNVTVDAELSEESKNAVENRVIAKEVNGLKQKDESLDKEVIALRERNAELEETVEKLQIKTTTEPSPFHHITDSANMKVLDFGMEGITEQYTGTITDESGNEITVPNPDYPQEIVNAGVYNEETGRYEHKCCVGNKNLIINEATSTNIFGVDFTVNEDGTVAVKGTNIHTNVNSDFKLNRKIFLKAGNYILSDSGSDNVAVWICLHVLGTSTYVYSNTNGGRLSLKEDMYVEIYVRVKSGATVDTVVYPMLRVNTDDSTFAPLVSKPFTLTSDRPLTKWDKLVKRDGVWGWSIWSKEYKISGDELSLILNNADDRKVRVYVRNTTAPKDTECRCNIIKYDVNSGTGVCGYWYADAICSYVPIEWLIPYGYAYDANLTSAENCKNAEPAFKAMVTDKGPIQVWADMQEEQAFIPLPDEEQILLNNLETYYGVTNVYNEQGCPMWIKYVADTKLYVDKKLLKIQSAII